MRLIGILLLKCRQNSKKSSGASVKAKLFIFLRQVRHQLFDEQIQAELATLFKDSSVGKCLVSPARVGQWQGNRDRYIGVCKNLFDLRRLAVVHNLHVIARMPEATVEASAGCSYQVAFMEVTLSTSLPWSPAAKLQL